MDRSQNGQRWRIWRGKSSVNSMKASLRSLSSALWLAGSSSQVHDWLRRGGGFKINELPVTTASTARTLSTKLLGSLDPMSTVPGNSKTWRDCFKRILEFGELVPVKLESISNQCPKHRSLLMRLS